MEASRKRSVARSLDERESRLAFPAVTPGSFNKVGTVSRSGWMPGLSRIFRDKWKYLLEGYVDWISEFGRLLNNICAVSSFFFEVDEDGGGGDTWKFFLFFFFFFIWNIYLRGGIDRWAMFIDEDIFEIGIL